MSQGREKKQMLLRLGEIVIMSTEWERDMMCCSQEMTAHVVEDCRGKRKDKAGDLKEGCLESRTAGNMKKSGGDAVGLEGVLLRLTFFVLNCEEPSAVAMCCGDGAAARRRNRRLRQILKREQLSVKMHVAAALHHSAQRSTQTDSYAAATCAATDAPAPVFDYVAPALVIENIAPVPAETFDAPSQQSHHGNRWY